MILTRLYVGCHPMPVRVATPADVLEALGWVPCDTCEGKVTYDPSDEFDTDEFNCPDCAFGYVPTDETVPPGVLIGDLVAAMRTMLGNL